tara:strand:+ start:2171 stop:2425 length:255 start_codon:yes stop_codon:yes gene_type:complete
MKEFRKSVLKAKKLGIEIKNPSIEQAPILIDELLNHAIKNKLPIRIVDKDFKLYLPFVEKFKKAMNAGCEIHIVKGREWRISIT